VNRLESTATAFIKPSYRFIDKLGITKFEDGDETSYIMTLYVDLNKLKNYLDINPNFISGTGKIKKDLTDRPFNSFTPIADETNDRSLSVSKKLNQDIKRDFYLSRKMSGIEFPSGLVSLRIVLQ
jgi:hypothetical protein